MNTDQIIQKLQKSGCRNTPVRRKLLEILLEEGSPISATHIVEKLHKSGFKSNKTTVYRQLETLQKHKVIEPVTLDPTIQMFEIAKHHHHHFVCNTCDQILDVESNDIESSLHSFEEILNKKGIKVQKHELTFFGLCNFCNQ